MLRQEIGGEVTPAEFGQELLAGRLARLAGMGRSLHRPRDLRRADLAPVQVR